MFMLLKSLLPPTFVLTVILSLTQAHAQSEQKLELVIETGPSSDESVAFSPDGKLMASNGVSVKLWDVASGREIKTLGENNSDDVPELELPILVTHSVAFLPGGKSLLAANYKKIRMWDIAMGQAHILYESATYIRSFALSPDGSTFAVGLQDRTVKLCDVATGQELHTLSGHVDPLILAITFSPDGKMLASSAGFDDKTIRLWDVETGRELRVLYGLTAGVTALAFSPDGKTLASTGDINNGIKLWDVVYGRELQTLYGHRDFINALEFSPDGKTLASAGSFRDGAIMFWDVRTGQVTRVFPDASTVHSIEFSPDGRTLASAGAGDDGIHLRLWDMGTGSELVTLTAHANWISLFVSSPDGKFLATSGAQQTIKLWNVAGGQILKSLTGHTGWIRALAFSPDGKILASGGEDKTIKLWDVTSGQELKSFGGNSNFPLLLTFSPDGRTLISCLFGDSVTYPSDNGRTTTTSSLGGVIRLWDVATGKELGTYRDYDPIAFSTDYKMVASTIKDAHGQVGNDIKVLNLDTGEQTILRGHTDRVALAAFTPDGKRLVSTSWDQTIRFWDLSTGRATIFASNNIYVFIAFSPDGRILAAGSRQQNVVWFWDVATGQRRRVFHLDEPSAAWEVFKIVPDYIRITYGVTTSDGNFKMRIGENGRLNLFDFKTGKLLLSLIALDENDWAVITPDGRFDTSKLENPLGLHWLHPNAPLTPLSFEVFMRDYFEPNLLSRLLGCAKEGDCGREFKPVRNVSSLNRTQPKIAITGIAPTVSPDEVEVTVGAEAVVSEYQKDSRGQPLSSGVYDLRLFRNGQLVGHATVDERLRETFRDYEDFDEELSAWREANRVVLTNGKSTYTFRVKLPRAAAGGRVEFSAYAFNDDRVKSETARATYTLPADIGLKAEPRRAYVIAFGVNTYDDPAWDLQFAGSDARAMRDVAAASLRARKEFAEVVEIPLISDYGTTAGRKVQTRNATKSNVRTVLDLLAGEEPAADESRRLEQAVGVDTLKRIHKANPDDVVLITFSSHGYADQNGLFYIVPSDIGRDSGRQVTKELLRRSISSDELSLWLMDVDAGEIVMIVDACHAASAVEGRDFKPAPMGSRGLGQLAFDKGMRILTATQAANAAVEAGGMIRHGLLTYALVREGLQQHKADFRVADKTINMKEWLEYGVFRVPGLYDDVVAGRLKSVGKARAELVGGNGSKRQSSVQQPALFDFTRKPSELILAQTP
jgi:WD40 repeat protein